VRASLFEETGIVPAESADFSSFTGPEPPSPVDIIGFVCYMPALRVKGQAFRRLFALPEFLSDQLKEDAACRFSSAITMSIKPSRR
jgi:hypothetical protein